jgi:TDG/mug DNA glycosylase family protein
MAILEFAVAGVAIVCESERGGERMAGERLEDILASGLSVVINPGLLAAAQGHHFAGRGNRFWRTLHLAGFTPHEVQAEDDQSILQFGCGLTAVVERPTARADQLAAQEFVAAALA